MGRSQNGVADQRGKQDSLPARVTWERKREALDALQDSGKPQR